MGTMIETLGGNSKEQLKSIIERVQALEEQKSQIGDDIKDVYSEAKGNGFDVKALKAIVKRLKKDADEVSRHEETVEAYLAALGDFINTPLGAAAMERARA